MELGLLDVMATCLREQQLGEPVQRTRVVPTFAG
jgi:hypothetical protein